MLIANDTLSAFLDIVLKQSSIKVPTLLAVDQVNALYTKTCKYYSAESVQLGSQDLELVKTFSKALNEQSRVISFS